MKDEADILLEGFTAEERRQVMEEFQRALCELAARCEEERACIGRRNQERRRAVDGVGPMVLGVHPFDYHFQRSLGHDWRDRDFVRWFRRQDGTSPGTRRGDDFSYAKVNSGGTRECVMGGLGAPGARRTARFRKVYPTDRTDRTDHL